MPFREMTRYLPLLWILWPILHIPGVPYLGDRIYSYVAAHRPRFLQSCSSGGCAIDPDQD
ncbi:MAG: hypothetical protein HC825_03920 [Oscillatoriales cyanobacterium RM1_1_9]|nr:hypothetical protein [Oscillatoriales cyanobacterium RM1_1_9]